MCVGASDHHVSEEMCVTPVVATVVRAVSANVLVRDGMEVCGTVPTNAVVVTTDRPNSVAGSGSAEDSSGDGGSLTDGSCTTLRCRTRDNGCGDSDGDGDRPMVAPMVALAASGCAVVDCVFPVFVADADGS